MNTQPEHDREPEPQWKEGSEPERTRGREREGQREDEEKFIILPPFPDDDPSLRDYYLKDLLKFYQDFIRITRSRPKSRPKDNARGGAGGATQRRPRLR